METEPQTESPFVARKAVAVSGESGDNFGTEILRVQGILRGTEKSLTKQRGILLFGAECLEFFVIGWVDGCAVIPGTS